jgi:ribonuclease III
MDQGLPAVKSWLIPLFRPYSSLAYSIVRTQHGLPPVSTPSSTPPRPSIKPPWTLSPTSASTGIDPDVAPTSPSTTIGHLSLFNQHVQKANRVVEWVYSDGGNGESGTKTTYRQFHSFPLFIGLNISCSPVWVVSVLVDGECLGKGKGGTKKAARNEAAKEGLVNLGVHV